MDPSLISAIHLAALQAEHGTDVDDRIRGYSQMSLLLKPKVVQQLIEHLCAMEEQIKYMNEQNAGEDL